MIVWYSWLILSIFRWIVNIHLRFPIIFKSGQSIITTSFSLSLLLPSRINLLTDLECTGGQGQRGTRLQITWISSLYALYSNKYPSWHRTSTTATFGYYWRRCLNVQETRFCTLLCGSLFSLEACRTFVWIPKEAFCHTLADHIPGTLDKGFSHHFCFGSIYVKLTLPWPTPTPLLNWIEPI